MSLAFLLKSKTVDSELDALFKTAVKPGPATGSQNIAPARTKEVDAEEKGSKKNKNKRKSKGEDGPTNVKRVKAGPAPTTSTDDSVPTKSPSKVSKKLVKDEKKKVRRAEKSPVPSSSKKSKIVVTREEDDDSDDDSDIENGYLERRQKQTAKLVEAAAEEDEMSVDDSEEDTEVEVAAGDGAEESSEADSDDDPAPSTLVHETEQAGGKSKVRLGKQKFVPSEETPERRDHRTVFVGNLPVAVAQKRPLQKQFQKHILALVPAARIESVRFRSVAFQKPTSKLPASEDDGATNKKGDPKISGENRHGAARASSWRSKLDEKDEEVVKKDEKQYLTPGQKKRIAFIHQEFHATADSLNAYVVFAHPVPTTGRPANLPPLPPTLDPYEAARLAVEKCNNTLFMERVIRVDRVGKVGAASRKAKALADGEEEGEEVDGSARALLDADPKFTVFVGNLDFASKEEDLRVFFENLLISEKGEPPAADEGDGEGTKKARSWVVRVRIVRDKETQLGKGFAYVQFAVKECVDEVLALEEVKLKFAKRKLRLQRCKTLPGSSVKVKSTTPAKGKSSKPARQAVVVPRGDPTLGERLAHLPKLVRKQAKAADGERIARRLAKKKARMAMGPPGKDATTARDRSRKSSLGKGVVNTGKKTGKPRVRNEKNKNTKK